MWSAEKLELFGVDDEFILGQFANESLQIETTLLQEDNVLIAHSLLWRDLGEDNSGPALYESISQKIELVVASLTLPFALSVFTLDDIDDVTVEILRVSDREVQSSDIGEDVLSACSRSLLIVNIWFLNFTTGIVSSSGIDNSLGCLHHNYLLAKSKIFFYYYFCRCNLNSVKWLSLINAQIFLKDPNGHDL